ncbi:MAG: ATP-binding protein [Psychrosphaera sp.]|nr:ATP-binding protein [Psychrosphaera sp.]
MYLDSIKLNHFRRFGADVEITMGGGPGATILLAPNGTGKTSIFEAIELGLTGSVKRVQNDMSILIGDVRVEKMPQVRLM